MDDKNEMIWELVGAVREIRSILRKPAGNDTNFAFQRWFMESAELLEDAELLLDWEGKRI